MGSTANPLTGSGWLGNAPGTAQPGSSPSSPNVPSWLDPFGLFGSSGGGPNPQAAPTSVGGPWGNPGGYQNPWGAHEIQRNAALTNIQAGQEKNQLAPIFAQLMQQYGGQAGDFFKQLMNLGSPFYKQKQQEAFTQGVGQNQNAAAEAQQRLRAQGYGATPSGAGAAMIGGMEMQGSQNLAEQYLQNLFQNEQLQTAGASGLTGLAGMFNPTQLLGGTSIGSNVQAPSTFFDNFNSIMSGLSGSGGSTGGTAVTL